jgi:Putative serine esterase (DUF676)
VATYSSEFDPNRKLDNPRKYGVPQFEPMLKAGGSFNARLNVPEDIRVDGHSPEPDADASSSEPKSVTWIIEVTSQIIFSSSASVNFELLVSRDERSLDYNFHAVPGHGRGHSQGGPGRVQDHQEGKRRQAGAYPAQPKGVYSRAVTLVVDDTASLWNTPKLPEHKRPSPPRHRSLDLHRRRSSSTQRSQQPGKQKKRKIHLVVLTHGLHSNLSADMLFMKESIDATAKQARENRRKRREEQRGTKSSSEGDSQNASTAPLSGGQKDLHHQPTDEDEDEDEEEIIVRGFDGNATKTENGIQYLGKRMARWLLELTYPDQPFRPFKKSMSRKISDSLYSSKSTKDNEPGVPSHSHSSIRQESSSEDLPYAFTSISFIGHSLGGLIQLYAIAYIQKHAPHFFEQLRPVNFVAMASPLLGLSNENPMYVKFALDFGLVGRTGQDLGLTWSPPTLAKSGWSAVMGGLGTGQKGNSQEDPGSKPLLRILPTGPAHRVLRMFRNRTLYSNVVNDGIVPLRTSCLLFLDWRGLEKVEKARRENGLIGTVAGWGWAEITGQSTASPNPTRTTFEDAEDSPDSEDDGPSDHHQSDVPQPSENATNEREENASAKMPARSQFPHPKLPDDSRKPSTSVIDEMWNWIRPSGKATKTDLKMYKRSQTRQLNSENTSTSPPPERSPSPISEQPRREPPMKANGRPMATRGDSILGDPSNESRAPPKTTIFESAGDILNPPMPPTSWIIDPSTRARTIFHDRVYHPEDIPPPPPSKKSTKYGQSYSSETSADSTATDGTVDTSGMRVEEKIARAYHNDLSWRKVLVRLEPDAHNNMIVRRMFANAYGWPVIKHLCDTHFADTFSAVTRDEEEPAYDRARAVVEQPVGEQGETVRNQENRTPPLRPESEMREAPDELAPLKSGAIHIGDVGSSPDRPRTAATVTSYGSSWDESYFRDTEDEDELDERGPLQRFLNPPLTPKKNRRPSKGKDHDDGLAYGTSHAEIADFLSSEPPPIMEGHRGLAPVPTSPRGSSQPSSPTFPKKSTAQTVGLRRSIDDPIRPPGSSRGFAENVARRSGDLD